MEWTSFDLSKPLGSVTSALVLSFKLDMSEYR
jgi:hypothetical protein